MIDKPTLSQALGLCPKCNSRPNGGFIDRRIDGSLALRVACTRHEMPVELNDIDNLVPLLAAASSWEMLLPDKCGNCGGSGQIPDLFGDADSDGDFISCPSCHGSGETWNEELVEAVDLALRDWEFEDVRLRVNRETALLMMSRKDFIRASLRAIVETLKGEQGASSLSE